MHNIIVVRSGNCPHSPRDDDGALREPILISSRQVREVCVPDCWRNGDYRCRASPLENHAPTCAWRLDVEHQLQGLDPMPEAVNLSQGESVGRDVPDSYRDVVMVVVPEPNKDEPELAMDVPEPTKHVEVGSNETEVEIDLRPGTPFPILEAVYST